MERGALRIYLGAAAGVGKTYAMLNEGRRRRHYGENVVVGFVEAHGRSKTADQVAELEVVPRKRIEYHGSVLEEMDVDALLARRPEVALVDELAHTNAPASRNEKRWEDVEELLEAGISVISTLNIQHLESLSDVVEQITSVRQQETIPDEVVRRADELQLVDLTPPALRNRLARGDVYAPERIDIALANYFRPGNMTALRELALLWLADRVDEGLGAYRTRHGIEQPWEARERIVVAVAATTDGERLVRRAARIAQRSKGDLVAIHVRPADGLAAPGEELLGRQRELVEELGGTYHEVVGEEPGAALVAAARAVNATQIVVSAGHRPLRRTFRRDSAIGRVIRGADAGIDVHVVSNLEGTGVNEFTRAKKRRPASLSGRRVAAGLALAVAMLPVQTWITHLFRQAIGLPAVFLLFLLLVVAAGVVGGLTPAVVAAVGGFLLVNWFFIEPHHTFTIAEPRDVLALSVFLAVAVTVGAVVSLAARRAAEGARARTEAEALTRIAGSTPASSVLETLRAVLGLDGAALLRRQGRGWLIEAASGDRLPESPEASTRTVELGPEHVVALAGGPLPAEDERVLETFARELAARVELHSLGVPEASVQLDIPDALPRVLADRGLLERALANVLSNAIRFSPPGMPARVTAGAVDGMVDVRITDRGPGVPPAQRDRLFKPFQRLGDSGHGEGVGLGLAVARGFVEAMGGG